MSKHNDGGPAFPAWELSGAGNPEMTCFGMTLRDYFAAKAMQGMLAYPGDESWGSHHNNNTADGVAKMAFWYSDAMIAAREAKP